jgi:hypothetical protein
LSQPRRDTADPKKAKSLIFYLLPFYFSFLPRATEQITKRALYQPTRANQQFFYEKIYPAQESTPKTPKNEEKRLLRMICSV